MTGISEENVIRLRWVVLVLMGLTVFGVYFAYDSVVPIQNSIQTEMGVDEAQYGLLFSLYSLPNVIFVLFGGLLPRSRGGALPSGGTPGLAGT